MRKSSEEGRDLKEENVEYKEGKMGQTQSLRGGE
jgi:hypothetical protein